MVTVPVRATTHPVTSRRTVPRVAILSTWHPEPADNGRKQRTRLMISALAREYEVVLISLLPPNLVTADLPLVPYVTQQYALPLPEFQPRSPAALLGSLSTRPRSVVATWSRMTARAIREKLTQLDIGAVIGTDLRTLRYLTTVSETAVTVLDEPDVSPFVLAEGPVSMRAMLREQKYRRFLRQSGSELDAVLVASDQEAVAYLLLAGSGSVHVIENGVQAFPQAQWRPNDSHALLYTGSLEYGANAEAVSYFAGEILPKIERRAEDVSLVVTGKVPEPLPDVATHPRVRLTGTLDSLHDVYLGSGVFVVPLLSGTGTRMKLLEAMAHGIPVVSTSKGAEGLPVENGRHLMLADTPHEFAAAVLRLFHSPELGFTLGNAGRELVRQHFTWQRQGAELRDLVERLLDQRERQA